MPFRLFARLLEQRDALDAAGEFTATKAAHLGAALAWGGPGTDKARDSFRKLERRTRPRAPGLEGMF